MRYEERLPLHGAPLQPVTSMLLGGHLPSSYTACVGPEAAPRPVRPWRLERVEVDANDWDFVPKGKLQPPDEVGSPLGMRKKKTRHDQEPKTVIKV